MSRITEIPSVRRAVTDDTALRPGRVFGTSGQFCLNLQQLYELRHAEERKGGVAPVSWTVMDLGERGVAGSSRS